MKLGLTLAAAVILAAGTASAQTADDIVKKHVEAIGGADAWKKVNSLKMVGSISAQGMEIPVTVSTLNGKGYRTDFEVMGSKNYVILTPKAGWMYMPVQQMQKPEPMSADKVKAAQQQLEIGDNLMMASGNGSKVELAGKEDVEGTDCYKLKVTRKDGDVTTEYVDAKTFYIVKETQKVKADGKEEESSTMLGNYQKLPEGIVVPMSVESGNGPVVIKTVEVNTIKDESIFKPDTKG